MKKSGAFWLATFGGVGMIPFSPGTWGSMAGVAAAWLLVITLGLPAWTLLLFAAALYQPAVWASREMERESGRKDAQLIVVDEVVGQFMALAPIRPEESLDWWLGFLVFRIFDMVKPLGIRRLERIPQGVGVVADDVGAGLCAMIMVAAYRWFTATL